MNERIKELEKQCWSHYINGTLIDGHLHFDTAKFAGLIVRECMNICKNHPSRVISNNWNADAVAPHLVQQFEEHFGVEE
jgi:hypothetical protein